MESDEELGNLIDVRSQSREDYKESEYVPSEYFIAVARVMYPLPYPTLPLSSDEVEIALYTKLSLLFPFQFSYSIFFGVVEVLILSSPSPSPSPSLFPSPSSSPPPPLLLHVSLFILLLPLPISLIHKSLLYVPSTHKSLNLPFHSTHIISTSTNSRYFSPTCFLTWQAMLYHE